MCGLAYPTADEIAADQQGDNVKVAIVDHAGTIVSVNEVWRRSAIEQGYESDGHGVGVNYLSLCDQAEGADAESARRAAKAVRTVLAGDCGIQTFEYVCAFVDDEQWAMFVASPLPPKWAQGAVVTHIDITATKDVGQALRRSEERLRQDLETLPVLIAYIDKAHYYQFINDAYETWFGPSAAELRGKTVAEVIGPDAYQEQLPHIEQCLAGETLEVERSLLIKGERRLHVRAHYVPDLDDAGLVRGMFVWVQDITKEQSLALRAEHQSMHDALTGLPNRAQLLQRLRASASQGAVEGRYGSLMILDLDHFKDINDTLGHPLGDKLLCAVARRLSDSVGADDIVARLGGDEFAIARSQATAACRCPVWARQTIDRLEAPFFIDGHELHISASIGIAPFRDPVNDVSQLLKQADLALYSAKAAGRGCHRIFADKMWTDLMRRQRTLQALRRAIHTDQMTLRYQPQVDLSTGALIAVETLLRWHHPQFGNIEPKTFIPIAESSGLIDKLGSQVLHETAARCLAWQEAGYRFKVAVNVSPAQIKHVGFIKQIQHVIAMGVKPDWLELEITEAMLVDTDRRDRHTLQKVVDLGIGLAIDDFGSGYSSLAYLKRLPVDKIKIEQAFIRDIGVDPDAEAIVKAIITLGRQLGKRVVAEGVETASQAAFLKDNGCDEAQGFYFAKPLTENHLMAWIDRR